MQAFPSLSAALMMLCRTTAVFSWQVCKWEPQQTALGPDRRNAKNKTEGEETGRIARRRNEYPHKIQLPELPESWIQYSIENFPSTPGHQHKQDIDVGPAPEPHSLTHFKSSGDFMRYLAEMLGQELVWSSFLRQRTQPVCLERALSWSGLRGQKWPGIISCWNSDQEQRGENTHRIFAVWIG